VTKSVISIELRIFTFDLHVVGLFRFAISGNVVTSRPVEPIFSNVNEWDKRVTQPLTHRASKLATFIPAFNTIQHSIIALSLHVRVPLMATA